MIEEIIIAYLNKNLSVPAFAEVPQNESRFVTVEKLGGSNENFINFSTLAIRSYSPTLLEAAQLNEEVLQTLENAEALDDVISVQLNSNYNNTDTAKKQYRYQAVFEITHY